jgi:hypothetical protein
MFMSGGAVTPEAASFLDRLPNRYVTKPFKNAELRRAIQQML